MFTLITVIKALLIKSTEPMTGYDIAKAIKGKTGNSHQQVYRELSKLHLAGEVKKVLIPQDGKPDKVVCTYIGAVDFDFTEPAVSDFTKTPLGYKLLTMDIINGTDHYSTYLQLIQTAETDFLQGKDL